MNAKITRRRFLSATGSVAAGLTATSAGYAENETINVAGIGTGGRFRHLMKGFSKIPGVRLAAVCDVWDRHLEMAKELADPRAIVSKNYHEILKRKDIDAVIIASPDHWHVPMTADACAAGKDVYVEKPLTHNAAQGRQVIDAQNEHRRIVQVGMQQRSMPHFQKGLEILRSGRLGDVRKVHLTWNRNSPRGRKTNYGIDPGSVDWKQFLGAAPEQPFDEYRFRNWRWFWDFGGGILTDLMVHYIDVANWYLDLEHPDTAVTIGDHFQNEGIWETPDTIQTLLRYPEKQVQIYFEGTFVNARNGAMLEFMGSEATLYLDRGRYELHPEPGRNVKYEEWILGGEKRRGADFYDNPDGEYLHLLDWVQCMRSRNKPNAPAEAGVAAVTGAHLGNHAYRENSVARWDDLF